VIAPAGIVLRNDAPVRKKEGLPVEVETLGTVPDSVELRLNGLAWAVDLRLGQKTGLFLDQRENYRAAAAHARGWAFDGFTSSGGFALSLAAVCDSVEAVDASEAALGRARGNAARNGIANIQFRAADVFDVLAQKASAGTRYDTIVLDPPAFAKSKSAIDKALSGYREINTKALRMLDPGGILVTCSCSRHVGESEFLGMLAQAARDAGRTLRIRERRTQSADHPILLTVPETQYLKCVIAEVI
jgi:23S rRNA (cytosine1962-C5)-methyltransferase